MAFVPEKAGNWKAGQLASAQPLAGGAMLYVNVPLFASLKLKVNVPTGVTVVFEPAWLNGTPLVTYTGPEYEVGEVHEPPPASTIQSGTKLPGFELSATRGSYVYQTA